MKILLAIARALPHLVFFVAIGALGLNLKAVFYLRMVVQALPSTAPQATDGLEVARHQLLLGLAESTLQSSELQAVLWGFVLLVSIFAIWRSHRPNSACRD